MPPTRSDSSVTYVAVTPAFDELHNLKRLFSCLERQRRRPKRWLIADCGSGDGTTEFVRELTLRHDWITAVPVPARRAPRRGAPVVRAFHAGVAADAGRSEVVAKVDADVSFDADFFERMLVAFESDRRLGMASGSQLEWVRGGWRVQRMVGGAVAAPVRAYRRECLAELLPLDEHLGWDAIDHVRARMNGWRTSVVYDTRFHHHRREGARQGRFSYWRDEGRVAHYLHYRPTYLLLRVAYRAWREPAAVAMALGWASAAVGRHERHADVAVAARIRRGQRLRKWHVRVQQARGARGAADE